VYYHHGGVQGVILCLYVNDILIFGTSLDVINEFKTFLCQNFDMKYLAEANIILNLKLNTRENKITLKWSYYVENILSHFCYNDNKPSPTPCDHSPILQKNKRIGRNQLRYSQIIGSLMYMASATRPDISFAMSKLGRFTSNLGDDRWHALKWVKSYFAGTMDYIIHYSGILQY
jgi:hypothetical protein